MARPTKLTHLRKEKFLGLLRQGKSVTFAASAIALNRMHAYEWRTKDPEFKQEWDDAVQCGTDMMEDEAWRRAMEGKSRPVFYRGQQCGSIQEYSDTLLIFNLKARRPEKYRDNVNVSADEGQMGELLDAIRRS